MSLRGGGGGGGEGRGRGGGGGWRKKERGNHKRRFPLYF